MRQKERIGPIINVIEKIWHHYPDMRLSQILAAGANESGWKDNDLFYLEDDRLHEGLEKYWAKIKLGQKRTVKEDTPKTG